MSAASHVPRRDPTPGFPARAALLVAFLATAAVPAAAQEADPPESPGATSTVLLENDRVRVVENRYEPGADGPVHTHRWPRAAYVVEGGVLELVAEDGTVRRVELAAGAVVWRPPETHAVRNRGATRVVLVETEVKGDAASGTSPGARAGSAPGAAGDAGGTGGAGR